MTDERAVIVAATPVHGHTVPMLQIAAGLHAAGHDVTTLAGTRFAALAPGRFVALSGAADYDDRELAALHPGRARLSPGPAQLIYDIQHVFGDAIPDQHAALQALLAEQPHAAVLTDSHFFGAWPSVLGAAGARPHRFVATGITVLGLSSRDTGPLGPVPPASGQSAAEANLAAAAMMAEALADGQAYVAEKLTECGATEPVASLFDGLVTVPDAYAQLCAPGAEFPRSDAPDELHFVGPLPAPAPAPDWTPPDWWDRLADDRPAVLVTQGTLANQDLGQLIAPTIAACASRDVLLIAALGRDQHTYRGPSAENVIVEPWIPFGALLPHISAYITNGGYGGVQQALAHGVPVLIAGDTEDKPLVAARIVHLQLGRDLGTAHPQPDEIAQALDAALEDARIHANLARIAVQAAELSPVEHIATLLVS